MNSRDLEIQMKLLESIEIMIEDNKDKLKLDYTITGKILSYDGVNNIYTVQYGDAELEIKARDGLTLSVGDVVYIRVVQGNFSEKFIDCKKP